MADTANISVTDSYISRHGMKMETATVMYIFMKLTANRKRHTHCSKTILPASYTTTM
jgi:hypothetical protein